MVDTFARVQAAALEHALVSESDARQYLALAGAVERSRRQYSDAGDGVFPAIALCLTTLAALDGDETSSISASSSPTPVTPASAPTPTPAFDQQLVRGELVVEGAAAALRQFDVSLDAVAELADVEPRDVRRVATETSGGR